MGNNLSAEQKFNLEGIRAADADKLRAKAIEEIKVATPGRILNKASWDLKILSIMWNLAPFIAIAIVVIIIMSIVGITKTVSKTKRIVRKEVKVIGGLFGTLKRILNKILSLFAMSPNMRIFFSNLNPNKKYNRAMPREQNGGRCDNLQWREDQETKKCNSTVTPSNIEWDIDVTKFPEFMKIPKELQKHFQSKKKVIIPWEDQATFFVPQCSKAKWEDGSDASYLFEDNGMSCARREFDSSDFTPSSYSANINYHLSSN